MRPSWPLKWPPATRRNGSVSYTHLDVYKRQIKACVAVLQKYPTFNASLDGDNLVLKQYVHIGFAADTPNGLAVSYTHLDVYKRQTYALYSHAETAFMPRPRSIHLRKSPPLKTRFGVAHDPAKEAP